MVRLAAITLLLIAPIWPKAGRAQSIPLFDAHVNLNDVDAFLGLMDRFEVERSVIFPGRAADNEAIASAAEAHPDRFIPFLSVSPEHREFRRLWIEDDPRLGALVDSLLSTGRFAGVGEISISHFPSPGFPEADFDPNGEAARSIFRAADRHGVPVLVHIEVTRIREFEAVLSDFPNLTVIWAHGGYTPLFLAKRMLERHPNLVYELSARSWLSHPRSPEYSVVQADGSVQPDWLEWIETMPDRFVIGSDASLRSVESDAEKLRSVRAFLDQLSTSARDRVARTNELRILGR